MAALFKPFDVQVDGNGVSMAGAKLYFYTTGTSTPQDTYTTSGLSVANPNPVVADANGLWPAIYLGTTDYKVILKTAADVTVQTLDPVLVNPAAATLSSQMDSAFGTTQYTLIQRGASEWGGITPKQLLDNKFGSTQGTIIYRGASDWAALAAPSAGTFTNHLTHAGTGNNPAYTNLPKVVFMCKATGTTKNAEFNAGTVTKNSTGNFTFAFTANISANAVILATAFHATISGDCVISAQSASSVTINTYDAAGTPADFTAIHVIAYG